MAAIGWEGGWSFLHRCTEQAVRNPASVSLLLKELECHNFISLHKCFWQMISRADCFVRYQSFQWSPVAWPSFSHPSQHSPAFPGFIGGSGAFKHPEWLAGPWQGPLPSPFLLPLLQLTLEWLITKLFLLSGACPPRVVAPLLHTGTRVRERREQFAVKRDP